MLNKLLPLIVSLVLITLSACDSHRVFEKNVDIPDVIWDSDSIQVFEFEITEPQYYHNLYINLRTLISYPYQNVYVSYWLEDENGEVLSSNNEDLNKLLDIRVFEAKSGKPIGDGLGDLFDNQFPVLLNYQFVNAGKYKLKFQHYMRVKQLPGIVSVGTRVETALKE